MGRTRGLGARGAGLLAVAAVVTAAACGDGDGGGDVQAGRPADFELSVDYLSQAVERSTSQPYRFEATMSMTVFDGGELSGMQDVPMLTGRSDGHWVYQRLDSEAFAEELAGEDPRPTRIDLDAVDLSMEVVADDHTVYLRAPDYDVLVAAARPGTTPPAMVEAVSQLGDAWGRVDLTALGDGILPGDVTSVLNAGQNADPRSLLDLVTQASDVEELGGEEVDGEPMTGLAADVSLVEMMEAQDQDPQAAIEQLERLPDAPPDAAAVLRGFRVPMEVWLDADGHVRRLTQDMGRAMRSLAEELGDEAAGGLVDWTFTVDFDDYGDDSIEVEIPDPAVTTDLTDAFRAMQLSG